MLGMHRRLIVWPLNNLVINRSQEATTLDIHDFYLEHINKIKEWLISNGQVLHWYNPDEQAFKIFGELIQQIIACHDEYLQIFWVSIDQGPNFNLLNLKDPYMLTCEDQGFFKVIYETLAYQLHIRLQDYNLHWNKHEKTIMKITPYFILIGIYYDF